MEIAIFSKKSVDRIKEKIESRKRNIEETCIILIDNSSSMILEHEGTTKIEAAKSAIHQILNTKHKVLYGVVTFSSTAKVIINPTYSYGKIRSEIEKIKTDSVTNMEIGVRTARNEFFDMPICKKRIILLSDGQPTCPIEKLMEEVHICSKEGIVIDTIAFGDSCNEELLKEIAEITGGIYQKAVSNKELIQTFKNLKYEVRYLEYKE